MSADFDNSMKKFPEQIYVSTERVYTGMYSQLMSVAHENLDSAVSNDGEVMEVGIYQLVRVRKFQKTRVVQEVIKEMDGK